MTEYKVITDGAPTELWASGFYGDEGRAKAEKMVSEGYWHKFMFDRDRHKTLAVVPVRNHGANA